MDPRMPTDNNDQKVWGRWQSDDRVSTCCISRGFCQQENLQFKEGNAKNKLFNLCSGETYSSIGKLEITLCFPGIESTRKTVELTVIDHARLCRFDDSRLLNLENYEENMDEQPLWFDVLIGADFANQQPMSVRARGQRLGIKIRVKK